MEILMQKLMIEKDLLQIYKQEFQFIMNPSLEGKTLTCNISIVTYPYTKDQTFTYITSVTITLILCQLVYVLIGKLIETSSEGFEKYTIEDYKNAISETTLKFISHCVRYKKPIQVNSTPIAKCSLMNTRKLKKFIIYEFEFSIGDRAVLGTLKAMKI